MIRALRLSLSLTLTLGAGISLTTEAEAQVRVATGFENRQFRLPIPRRPAFVQVDGHQLLLDGKPFHYAGWNTYYMMVYAASPGLVHYVNEVFDEAQSLGLSVLRTWAFNDGASQWNALQSSPGVYQEQVFRGLDYVIREAGRRGIKLILPLVNNWDDYGGMNQYVAWSASASSHDDFYTDAQCRQWYKAHASTVLGRVNTLNGIAYRNDPTILAWELANEPRCSSDASGATLGAWIAEMAAHLQAEDKHHLVTTGSEGFWGPAQSSRNPKAWMANEGADFLVHHQVPDIDFATVHAWPDHWGIGLSATTQWIRDHAIDAELILEKPVIIEEFGKAQPANTKDLYYQWIYDEIHLSASTGGAAAGSNFWHLLHDDYAIYDDGFGVFLPSDMSTLSIIASEATKIHSLR